MTMPETALREDVALMVVGRHTVAPEDLDPPDMEMCCTMQHISVEQIETEICRYLAAEEDHRQQRALCAMRAGALFYLLKQRLKVSGRKYTGFWEHCEQRFGVNRATISRKMRLVARWAAKNGASEELIAELASASQVGSSEAVPKAVQLAFDWIGGLDLSDLYRREKLVNYGPQNTGKLLGDPNVKRHTRERMLAKSQKEADKHGRFVGALMDGFLSCRTYEMMSDRELQVLREIAYEFERAVGNMAAGRRLPRLGENWRLMEVGR